MAINTKKQQYERFYVIAEHIVSEILNLNWKDGGIKRQLKGEHLKRLNYSVKTITRDCIAVIALRKKKGLATIKLGQYAYAAEREDTNLTFSIHVKRAYKGMVELGYLKEITKGYYARNKDKGITNKSRLTRYQATEKLVNLFSQEEQKVLPVIVPTKISPLIRVRIKRNVNGAQHSVLVAVDESVETERMRKNLNKINGVLLQNWYDLKIDDEEMMKLEARLSKQEDEQQIDLSRRTLYRVFNDQNLTKGGRFYGGWWQNVPKEYRDRLLINGKRMVEFDYSNQHPFLLYAQEGIELDRDCYRDVVNLKGSTLPSEKKREELRSLVKSSFNAMLNSSHPLKQAPKGVSPQSFGLTWKYISDSIIQFHSPIAHHFYTGVGLRLQRVDSDIAELVLLAFTEKQIPILPLHDSFLVHQGYEDFLKETMLTAFKKVVGKNVKVDKKHLKPLMLQTSPLNAKKSVLSIDLTLSEIIATLSVGYEARLTYFFRAFA